MEKADIGLIGLAVMDQNLVLNMDDHGFRVAVFNRTVATVDQFIAGNAKGTKVIGTRSLEELVTVLKRPRRVMLLVKAGPPVDSFIERLLPLLEPGDIIIDGGNSNYQDTMRRTALVESKGLLYIGTGVSGGEEEARHGPSIMPGGSGAAWPHVKPIFQAIAAKVEDGSPCCDWVGESGAGHMATILREPGPTYRVRYDKVALQAVTNSERCFPEAWIAPSRTDVSDEFLEYAGPLIGEEWPTVPLVAGLQRFARLVPEFAEKKLPAYVPDSYRS